jgi:hypothetical protein
VSGEAHPKELNETCDSQNFRYSEMFPPKSTNLFHCEASLPARAYPSPIQPTNHAGRRVSSVSFLFYYAHPNTRLLSSRRVVANLFSPDPRDHRGPFSPSSPSANLLSFHSTIQGSSTQTIPLARGLGWGASSWTDGRRVSAGGGRVQRQSRRRRWSTCSWRCGRRGRNGRRGSVPLSPSSTPPLPCASRRGPRHDAGYLVPEGGRGGRGLRAHCSAPYLRL